MNLFRFASLATGTLFGAFGASIGLFAYGADVWTSTGIGFGVGICVALSELFPVFD